MFFLLILLLLTLFLLIEMLPMLLLLLTCWCCYCWCWLVVDTTLFPTSVEFEAVSEGVEGEEDHKIFRLRGSHRGGELRQESRQTLDEAFHERQGLWSRIRSIRNSSRARPIIITYYNQHELIIIILILFYFIRLLGIINKMIKDH